MDPGFRTPLLDFFRRGEVARDVRLLAASGAFAPRAHEQLALLVILVDDQDPDIRATAERTLATIPRVPLEAFLARSDVPEEMKAFFSARGIEPGPEAAAEAEQPLIESGPEAEAPSAEQDQAGALQRIAAMDVMGRLKLAMRGTREERAILIRDPNKIVGAAVLSGPKLTESEVEGFAKMANLSEDVLRIICHNRAWTKSYAIVSALTRNPKTPLALSMTLMQRLNEKDVKTLSVDRNVPEALRIAARKKVVIGQKS